MYLYMKAMLQNIKSCRSKFSLSVISAAFICVFSVTSHAESMSATYKVYWGGMHVADLAAKTDKNSISTSINSKGMVALLSNYTNKAEATLNHKNGEYVPRRFYKQSDKVTGQKHTEISYAENGEVTDLKSSENLSQETAQNAKNLKAVDPLSAFMIAREKIRAAIKQNETAFSLPMYDGKRLATLDFELIGHDTKTIQGKSEKIFHIRMTRTPIEGFGEGEHAASVVELYVSPDEHLIPLMADAKAPIGHATIIIDQRCFPAEQCA